MRPFWTPRGWRTTAWPFQIPMEILSPINQVMRNKVPAICTLWHSFSHCVLKAALAMKSNFVVWFFFLLANMQTWKGVSLDKRADRCFLLTWSQTCIHCKSRAWPDMHLQLYACVLFASLTYGNWEQKFESSIIICIVIIIYQGQENCTINLEKRKENFPLIAQNGKLLYPKEEDAKTGERLINIGILTITLCLTYVSFVHKGNGQSVDLFCHGSDRNPSELVSRDGRTSMTLNCNDGR